MKHWKNQVRCSNCTNIKLQKEKYMKKCPFCDHLLKWKSNHLWVKHGVLKSECKEVERANGKIKNKRRK